MTAEQKARAILLGAGSFGHLAAVLIKPGTKLARKINYFSDVVTAIGNDLPIPAPPADLAAQGESAAITRETSENPEKPDEPDEQ
jgi:hypothetical protein